MRGEKVRVKELEMMGGESGGYRGESCRPGADRRKMGNGDKQTKRGKRNRIKVIGDAKGRERKRNSATNIPRKPASVTNAIRGVTKKGKKHVTDDSGHTKHRMNVCC